MSLDIYLCKEFRTTHERDFFYEFSKKLSDNWKSGDAALLGNVDINGNELDALLIKNDGIIIIDFKNFGGSISFYENGPWYDENKNEIRGGAKVNPYYQLKIYREYTINFLNRNKSIFKNNEPNFFHTSGIVVFHKPIKVINIIPEKINSWFKITSQIDSFKVIKNQTSKEINISKYEIDAIVKLIGYEEKINFADEVVKQPLIEEKLKKIFRNLYLLKVKQEILNNLNFKEDFDSIYSKSTTKGVQEINDKRAKSKTFLISTTESINTYIDIVYNTLNDLIVSFKISSIDIAIIKEYNSYSLIEFIKKNIQHDFSLKNDIDFSNEIISFYSNTIQKSYKYSCLNNEVFFNAVISSYHSPLFLKILFSLRFYLNSFFSSELLDRTFKGYSGISVDYVIRLIYTFDDSCNHYFERSKSEFIDNQKSRGLRYFKSITLPPSIKEINKLIIEQLNPIFNNDNILFLFLQSLGLEFLFKDQIDISDLYLVNANNDVNKSILNLKEQNNYLNTPFLLNKVENSRLQLLFTESLSLLSYPKHQIEWVISEEIINGCSGINDPLNNLLSLWENNKYLYGNYTPQNVNMEFCKMTTKYGESGYLAKTILVEFVCNNISCLNNYIKSTETVYKMPLSKRFYDIMYTKFVKEAEAKRIDRILTKKEISAKVNKNISEAINAVFSNNSSDYLRGYDDVKAFIKEHLKFYINPEIKKLINIRNPEGILLYGPPGCGKTFFAKWISDLLGFKFIEVPRSSFGSPYVDGAMKELIKIINDLKKTNKQVIFFDEFDSVAVDRKSKNIHNESEKVVNTLLQEIPKITESGNLIIAATNYISKLDDAVIRSGRFSLKIPIFPPSPIERSHILKYHVFNNFPADSPLLQWLIIKEAHNDIFWENFSRDLILFSNSDLKLLSERIVSFMVDIFINEKSFNPEDLVFLKKFIQIRCDNYIDFFQEVQQNYSELFEERMNNLYNEMLLKGCIKSDQHNERTPIGFRMLNNKINN